MNDIYDIQWNIFWSLSEIILSIPLIGILWFLLYLYARKYNKKNLEIIHATNFNPQKNLIADCDVLDKEYRNMKKTVFYTAIMNIFFYFIEQKYSHSIQGKTFQEILRLALTREEWMFLEKIYFWMYEVVERWNRVALIKELKSILQNNIL